MKKVTTIAFLFALAIGASAQSLSIRPTAVPGPAARASVNATNATVAPNATVQPNAVHKKK